MGAITVTSYRYRAARSDGALLTGLVDAATTSAAAARLAERGLMPVELATAPGDRERKRSVDRTQLALAFRSLASLVGHGVPLGRAVSATVPLVRGALRSALEAVQRELGEGRPLAASLRAQPVAIPDAVLGVVASGERAGRLRSALEEAATQLEREAELAGRLRQALAYPAVLMLTGLASMAVIGLVVVPRFTALLADLGQELPASTRFLLGATSAMQRWGPFLAVVVIGAATWAHGWIRTPRGRRA